jgi:hypothetical protein
MTILNSSVISDMNVEMVLSNRSTLLSLPVLSRVVMANVAIERFEFEMSVSMSGLHGSTALGLKEATLWRIRMAANLLMARG